MLENYIFWMVLASPFILVVIVAWAVIKPPVAVTAVIPISFLCGAFTALLDSQFLSTVFPAIFVVIALAGLLGLIVWYTSIYSSLVSVFFFGALLGALAWNLGSITVQELQYHDGIWMLSGLIELGISCCIIFGVLAMVFALKTRREPPAVESSSPQLYSQLEPTP